ncbi:MAG: hypothetical protein IPQ00_03325 [Chloracidobacterium sp.]|nr:hypothetical protein [Chloracidobacterium sp.]
MSLVPRAKEAAAEFVERVDIADDGDDSGLSAEDALFLAQQIEVPDKDTDDEWRCAAFPKTSSGRSRPTVNGREATA